MGRTNTKTKKMGLGFSAEQEQLRESVRKLLEKRWTRDHMRKSLDTKVPFDRDLWDFMARELGLHAMSIPEQYGGTGFGFAEQAVVLEEFGRVMYISPYLSTVIMASNILMQCENESMRRKWLPQMADGSRIATVAFFEEDGIWRKDIPQASATRRDEKWRVSGRKSIVLDGAQADLLLTLARKPDGDPILLAVDASEEGVSIEDLPTLDLTRRLASVQYLNAVGEVVAEGDGLRPALERTLDITAVALACEQVGGASMALDMTIDYAKTRTQFGVPIGSFQAIKFKCADMLLSLEAAKSAAYYAVAALDNNDADFPIAASAAKAVCSDAYMSISSEMIQVLGGIGYTWEHDAHLFFKRAKASQILFGDAEEHRERLATRLGI